MIAYTDISDLERTIVCVVSGATFPPATAAKRFIKDLGAGYIKQLSPRGRWFLAFIAHRFRRQYSLTGEQWKWVNDQLNAPPVEAAAVAVKDVATVPAAEIPDPNKWIGPKQWGLFGE